MLFFKPNEIRPNYTSLSCAVVVATLFESARGESVDDYGCANGFNETNSFIENSECSNFLVGVYAATLSFSALTGLMVLLNERRSDNLSLPYANLVLLGFAASTVISLGSTLYGYSNCNYEDPACIRYAT